MDVGEGILMPIMATQIKVVIGVIDLLVNSFNRLV